MARRPGPPYGVSVDLAGGASLGAYHAGAVAALLVAIEAMRSEQPNSITLEAVGGASAGALVATLSAVSHLRGHDPVDILKSAWVDRVDFDLLHRGATNAPMALASLYDEIRELFESSPRGHPSPTEDVAIHIALTGLRGLSYRIDGLRGNATIPASTYVDWADVVLEPGADLSTAFDPPSGSLIDAALASAANPGVFPARLLDRSRDVEGYIANGIDDLPRPPRLWFTDGALLQVEPMGRVVRAARSSHRSAARARVAVLVDARSEGPSTGRSFADPEEEPSWLGALARSLDIITAQSLYDDVRRIGTVNRRLEDIARLIEPLAELLGSVDHEAVDRVGRVVDDLGVPRDGQMHERIAAAILHASGLDDAEHVVVDVISPLLLLDDGSDGDVEDLLSGEFLAELGGFAHRSIRLSDFTLGYASVRSWMPAALERLGYPRGAVATARSAIENAHDCDWRAANAGRASMSSLPLRARARLARTWGRAVWALARHAMRETMR